MGRIELQELAEQHRGHIGHAHGHAGMAGIGLLHRIHGQRADGVGEVAVGNVVGVQSVHVGGLETGAPMHRREERAMKTDRRRNMPPEPEPRQPQVS